MGNHDMHAAQIIPKKCKVFNFPENWYQLDYHQRKAILNGSIWFHEENELDYTHLEVSTIKKIFSEISNLQTIRAMGFNFFR